MNKAIEILMGFVFGLTATLLVFWGLTEFFYWTEIW
jgi:hypothetical protein